MGQLRFGGGMNESTVHGHFIIAKMETGEFPIWGHKSMAGQINVIVVDDHSLFRIGVIQTLELDKDITVVGEGSSCAEAVQLASTHAPDIALLDVWMPGNGIDAAEQITKLPGATKVIMLTVSEAQGDIVRALEAGAVGYVVKGISAKDLISAVRSVAEGGSFMSPNLGLKLVSTLSQPTQADLLSSLSMQEERTLRLVASGLSNREVGEKLGVLEKTIKFHMTKAMAKLGVRNRVEATIVARQGWGIVSTPTEGSVKKHDGMQQENAPNIQQPNRSQDGPL